jgi:ATP-dependent Lon protease
VFGLRFRKRVLPLVSSEGFIGFPHLKFVLSLRSADQLAVFEALNTNDLVILCPNSRAEHSFICTLCRIEDKVGSEGTVQVLLRGLARVRIKKIAAKEPFLKAEYVVVHESDVEPDFARMRDVIELLKEIGEFEGGLPKGLLDDLLMVSSPGKLADLCMYNPDFSFEQRKEILNTVDPAERLEKVRVFLKEQSESLKVWSGYKPIPECEECDDFAEKAFDLPPYRRAGLGRQYLEHLMDKHQAEVMALILEKYGSYFTKKRALR